MVSDRLADCPFCEIIHGNDPEAEVIAEGTDWVAFLPLHPATLGHVLIVPRAHVRDFWHVDGGTASSLSAAALRVGRALDAELRPDGMNLITSAGAAADQTVFHAHMHLVPRWHSDNMGPLWPSKDLSPRGPDREVARRLRRAAREPGR
jgi:histidine triad (HIT) family protein